ncbi:MAG: outer membrane lipoprotein carrier protein LolA [Parvularculales bacterium]
MAGLFLSVPAFAQSNTFSLTPQDKALVGRISQYFNSFTHLEGNFTQIDPQGRTTKGKIYLRRPARFRFEYTTPETLLVVSDGTWLIIQEDGYGPAQRYPLGLTPLRPILSSGTIDLERVASIVALMQENGFVSITLADPNNQIPGTITLIFDNQITELRQWIVTDARNQRTHITLSDLVFDIPAPPVLFTVDESGGRLERFRRPR